MACYLSLVFLIVYVTCCLGAAWMPPCDHGVMTIEQFQLQPAPVPSPGYVYYTIKATVTDSNTARVMSKGDLQMTIELLSPEHGVVPMPCSHGVGSW